MASRAGDVTTGAGVRAGAEDAGAGRDGLGDDEVGAEDVDGADAWALERAAGAGPSAVGRAGAGAWLISRPTPEMTAATATTPVTTVMAARKLISSMPCVQRVAEGREPAQHDRPSGYSGLRPRRGVRVAEPGLLPSAEPGMTLDNTRQDMDVTN